MGQGVKVLAVLAEDLGLVPGTTLVRSHTLLWPPQIPAGMWLNLVTHTPNKKNLNDNQKTRVSNSYLSA